MCGVGCVEHVCDRYRFGTTLAYRAIAFFRLTPKGEYEESWRES
jgi:hypothetical protein